MKTSRRNFLKFAGVSAAGLCFSPVGHALAAGGGGHGPVIQKNPKALSAHRWAMVVDTRKLKTTRDIQPLVDACHAIHNVPDIEGKQEIKWLWSDTYGHTFTTIENNHLAEDVEKRAFLLLCNHCKNPPCVRVCPTQATFQREDGVIMMDFHRCIGCRYCMAGCPYGARSFNFQDPHPFIEKENKEFPTRMRGVVEKCNFCAERLAVGEMPACVEASKGALVFGDLEDESSEVRKVLRENFTIRRKPSLGTEPGVYYII
ncbi:MAG: sulfate reduction electron transfer complex DsrMKJOP subunit DsrO [Desulfovibrionaceae bacterium]